jgi:hypothetical protein
MLFLNNPEKGGRGKSKKCPWVLKGEKVFLFFFLKNKKKRGEEKERWIKKGEKKLDEKKKMKKKFDFRSPELLLYVLGIEAAEMRL